MICQHNCVINSYEYLLGSWSRSVTTMADNLILFSAEVGICSLDTLDSVTADLGSEKKREKKR